MPVRETARDRQTQACGCGSIPHTGDTPGKAAMRTEIREGRAGSIPALGTMSPIRRRERIEVGIHTSFHNKPLAAAGGRCDR